MSDALLQKSACRLLRETVGNLPRINTELCRFKNGSPASIPANGSRLEELLLFLGILKGAGGRVSLNPRKEADGVYWDW
jgi:hypothetical protein